MLETKVDIYYFNNSQSYPKSASVWKKNEVFPKVFGAAFFKKGQFTSVVLQQSQQPAHKYAKVVTYGISNYADA